MLKECHPVEAHLPDISFILLQNFYSDKSNQIMKWPNRPALYRQSRFEKPSIAAAVQLACASATYQSVTVSQVLDVP